MGVDYGYERLVPTRLDYGNNLRTVIGCQKHSWKEYYLYRPLDHSHIVILFDEHILSRSHLAPVVLLLSRCYLGNLGLKDTASEYFPRMKPWVRCCSSKLLIKTDT